MTMPDHVHLLTAPLDRELSVAAFLKWFKRWFNESYGAHEKWQWQLGGFDRLLRTSETIHEKWNYIRENPVRAGLVEHWKQWPYQKGFADGEKNFRAFVSNAGGPIRLASDTDALQKTRSNENGPGILVRGRYDN
jgi:hypothetical protein